MSAYLVLLYARANAPKAPDLIDFGPTREEFLKRRDAVKGRRRSFKPRPSLGGQDSPDPSILYDDPPDAVQEQKKIKAQLIANGLGSNATSAADTQPAKDSLLKEAVNPEPPTDQGSDSNVTSAADTQPTEKTGEEVYHEVTEIAERQRRKIAESKKFREERQKRRLSRLSPGDPDDDHASSTYPQSNPRRSDAALRLEAATDAFLNQASSPEKQQSLRPKEKSPGKPKQPSDADIRKAFNNTMSKFPHQDVNVPKSAPKDTPASVGKDEVKLIEESINQADNLSDTLKQALNTRILTLLIENRSSKYSEAIKVLEPTKKVTRKYTNANKQDSAALQLIYNTGRRKEEFLDGLQTTINDVETAIQTAKGFVASTYPFVGTSPPSTLKKVMYSIGQAEERLGKLKELQTSLKEKLSFKLTLEGALDSSSDPDDMS